jgi:hypothetical protein
MVSPPSPPTVLSRSSIAKIKKQEKKDKQDEAEEDDEGEEDEGEEEPEQEAEEEIKEEELVEKEEEIITVDEIIVTKEEATGIFTELNNKVYFIQEDNQNKVSISFDPTSSVTVTYENQGKVISGDHNNGGQVIVNINQQ